MSSPIAISQKRNLRKFLVRLHQKTSHKTRTTLLADLLAKQIDTCFPKHQTIKCLDVGCGDMIIAESIADRLSRSQWNCIDIHPLPDSLKNTVKWSKYKCFDGQTIPFEDDTFDIVLFCDVLHHTPESILSLLKEAGRVGKIILIKDHFEYGYYSRTMLRLMDFIGNWGYGISIPKQYFTYARFEKLCQESHLFINKVNKNINLYSHIPALELFIKPKWQFIAQLHRSKSRHSGE